MSAAKPKRTCMDDAADAELLRWPGVVSHREVRGKHYALVLTFEGRSRFVTYSGTPGDTFAAPMTHVRDLKGVLRELGATRTPERKAPARERRQRQATPAPAPRQSERPVAGVGPLSDPFAALASVRTRLVEATPFVLPIPAPSRPTIRQAIASMFRRAA